MAPGLFGFGVSLAFEREQGTLIYRQAIPMPAGSYLLARMVMAMMFVAIGSLLMIMLAVFVAHVPLTFMQCATVLLVNVLGVLPFCAMGLFIGTLVSGQAAPAIVNLIYLPMAFLSGLWVPMQLLRQDPAAARARSGQRITCCSLSLEAAGAPVLWARR